MIAICKIWSFSFSKLEWHNLHFLNLEGRGIVGETNQISDTWEYSIKFRLLSSPKCGGTARQSPARAEQIHRNLLYDVGVLLFPWFEPWLDNRLKTFVMCSPADYWEKRWQKKTQPAQHHTFRTEWEAFLLSWQRKTKCPCVMSYYTVNRKYKISCTVMYAITLTNMSVNIKPCIQKAMKRQTLTQKRLRLMDSDNCIVNLDTVNVSIQFQNKTSVWLIFKSMTSLITQKCIFRRH